VITLAIAHCLFLGHTFCFVEREYQNVQSNSCITKIEGSYSNHKLDQLESCSTVFTTFVIIVITIIIERFFVPAEGVICMLAYAIIVVQQERHFPALSPSSPLQG